VADVPPCDGAAPIADQRYAPGSPPSGATERDPSGPQYLGPSARRYTWQGERLRSHLRSMIITGAAKGFFPLVIPPDAVDQSMGKNAVA
jgi:hypothetical protein